MYHNEHQKSRRDFLKKAAYTAPVILTISAMPAFASNGSHCVVKGSKYTQDNKYSRFESLSKKGPSYAFNDKKTFTSFGKSSSKIGGPHGR